MTSLALAQRLDSRCVLSQRHHRCRLLPWTTQPAPEGSPDPPRLMSFTLYRDARAGLGKPRGTAEELEILKTKFAYR